MTSNKLYYTIIFRLKNKKVKISFSGTRAVASCYHPNFACACSHLIRPEAIDHKLLVPFHYFCVSDPIDLSGLKWQGNRYQVTELENLYNLHHEKRVRIILDSMKRYLSSIEKMKAIGFCASIKHAEAMEKSFNDVGIKAISVTANTPKETRRNAKKWLEAGEVKIIFTRDVYNEGVDIPCINTVLFLRPTESLFHWESPVRQT